MPIKLNLKAYIKKIVRFVLKPDEKEIKQFLADVFLFCNMGLI